MSGLLQQDHTPTQYGYLDTGKDEEDIVIGYLGTGDDGDGINKVMSPNGQ